MGSLSGLLHEVRLWVTIAEIGTDTIIYVQMAYKHLSHGLLSTSVRLQPKYCNLSGQVQAVRVLILQLS